jgi:hypothetical protein
MGELTNNISLTCDDENRRGGMRKMWVANKTNITSFTAHSTNHEYTNVVMDSTADVWYEIQAEFERKGQNSEGSTENGSALMSTTITVFVPLVEKTKALAIQELFESCKVAMIYSDYNSKAFVKGYDEFLKLDAAMKVNVTETQEEGLQGANGYTLVFTGKSAEIAREYSGTISTSAGSVRPATA